MASPISVLPSAYPYLELEFTIGVFQAPTILAYVDTGFDGYLIIPAAQTVLLGPSQFSAPWELGDGSIVQAQKYRGDVRVSSLAVAIPARITLLGEEYLVGRGIVDHLRMTFDHGQRLLVEV